MPNFSGIINPYLTAPKGALFYYGASMRIWIFNIKLHLGHGRGLITSKNVYGSMGTYRLNQMGIYSQTFPVPLKYRRQSVLQPPNKKAPASRWGLF